MIASFSVLGCGALGFVLYEFLRVYKKRTSGQTVSEIFSSDYYFIIIMGAAVIGLTSAILSAGELSEAIYLGFSLPTCASAILGKSIMETAHAGTDLDDNEQVEPKPAAKVHSDKDAAELVEEFNDEDPTGLWLGFRNYLHFGA